MEYFETPVAFFWRRLHSFSGLVLVLFIIGHLLTNSQAALLIGEDGAGFIKDVNWIHDLPYLPVIESLILLVPFLIHGVWGLTYLWHGKPNSWPSNGTKPALPQYPRNQFYTWQRLTSWILIFGVIGHVAQMRFAGYPSRAEINDQTYYINAVTLDEGLYTLGARLNFTLLDEKQVNDERIAISSLKYPESNTTPEDLIRTQEIDQKKAWLEALESKHLHPGEVIAISPDFGTAELLLVRNTFKSPLMVGLYSGFVIASVFHAFNGLWTFLITWGVLLTDRSQRYMKWVSIGLMFIMGSLALATVWLTYWINLRH